MYPRDASRTIAFVIFTLAFTAAACTNSRPGVSSDGDQVTGDPAYDLVDAGGWTEFRSPAHRGRLAHPDAWQVSDSDIDPGKLDVVSVLVVSSFTIRPGSSCAHAPVEALRRLPADGIFITVYERLSDELEPDPTTGFDAKPARFGPWLGSIDSSVSECMDVPDDSRTGS